jgi:hypothetical protein
MMEEIEKQVVITTGKDLLNLLNSAYYYGAECAVAGDNWTDNMTAKGVDLIKAMQKCLERQYSD